MDTSHTHDITEGLEDVLSGDDTIEWIETEDPSTSLQETRPPWKVLVVDDDEEVHEVTKYALGKFRFDQRPLELYNAYSGMEARQMLQAHPDFALVFMDVVMETDNAGLETVNFIRQELKNPLIRIILRTGQPGAAPEDQVIVEYDIDDYKSKGELTTQKLHTSIISSLRAYRELIRIESIVQQRTRELIQANEVLSTLNKDLTDSINYARRIQFAILPDPEVIKKELPRSFVYYQPKDIVSGDFYWFASQSPYVIIANVDCTGHGVPGALMSVLGYNLLNRIIHDLGLLEPDKVLHELDNEVREVLNQESNSDTINDGMDLALCVINLETRQLLFGGAHRPLFFVRNGEVLRLEGSHYPIGHSIYPDKSFSSQTMEIFPGDRFYLFSDGFVDQFGGEKGRKYTPKRFREFIGKVQASPITEQLTLFETEFNSWMGNQPQLDDVCLIGIEPI